MRPFFIVEWKKARLAKDAAWFKRHLEVSKAWSSLYEIRGDFIDIFFNILEKLNPRLYFGEDELYETAHHRAGHHPAPYWNTKVYHEIVYRFDPPLAFAGGSWYICGLRRCINSLRTSTHSCRSCPKCWAKNGIKREGRGCALFLLSNEKRRA